VQVTPSRKGWGRGGGNFLLQQSGASPCDSFPIEFVTGLADEKKNSVVELAVDVSPEYVQDFLCKY